MLQACACIARSLVEQMLQRLAQQDATLAERDRLRAEVQRKAATITLARRARSRSITFELARLKRWKFGAKTEAMTAEQRGLFEETLRRRPGQPGGAARRAAAPPPLQRPTASPRPRHAAHAAKRCPSTCGASSTATSPRTPPARRRLCGRPMARVGEDVSERLDIVPARVLRAPPYLRQVGLPLLPALVQEPASARRSSKAASPAPGCWRTRCQPLRRPLAVLPARADQRPQRRAHAALDAGGLGRPGRRGARAAVRTPQALRAGKRACCTPTRRRWRCWTRARARRARPTSGLTPRDFDTTEPGRGLRLLPRARRAVPDSVPGRRRAARREPMGGHAADRSLPGATTSVLNEGLYPERRAAGCVAHARRKFDELAKAKASAMADGAIVRFARIYAVEADLVGLVDERAPRAAAGARGAAVAGAPALARARAQPRARRQPSGQGDRLQPEPLGGADAPPATTARCRSTTTTSSSRSSPGRWGARRGCSSAANSPGSARPPL